MQRSEDAAGSAVLAALEGTRPLLVEVQALIARHPAFDAAPQLHVRPGCAVRIDYRQSAFASSIARVCAHWRRQDPRGVTVESEPAPAHRGAGGCEQGA